MVSQHGGMTPQEHIDEFKRFAAAYLRWVNFNFDRIVSDAVRRNTQKSQGEN